MQLHPEYLILKSFLDPIPNLPNFLNPNHVQNTLISSVCFFINAHLIHKATNNNHCYIYVILIVIRQNSRCHKYPTIWRTIKTKSSSSYKPWMNTTKKRWNPTNKTLMRKWRNYQNNSKQFLQYSQISLTLCHPRQPRNIHWLLRTLLPWFCLTRCIHHCKGYTIPKLVTCGPSKTRSAHQNSMSSSLRKNSKETLLWISRTSITTSICASMRWLCSENTFLLVNIPSKETLSLNNTSS